MESRKRKAYTIQDKVEIVDDIVSTEVQNSIRFRF